jgi:O-methyltransferase domain/Dimerisation domain
MSAPPLDAYRLFLGHFNTQAIYVAAKLRIPDALSDGPRSADELATELGADAIYLRRVLRYLTTVGIFVEEPEGVFSNSPMSAMLAEGPRSLRDAVVAEAEIYCGIFSRLIDGVRSGESPATIHLGQPFFEWLSTEPEMLALYTRRMGNFGNAMETGIEAYDFADARVVVDVGGGEGGVLASILSRTPEATGIVFDLPAVVEDAASRASRHGLGDRLVFEGGDFFQSVPSGDTYVLSRILHDWNDVDATRILRRVVDAAKPGARVVVFERVLHPEGTWLDAAADLLMLAVTPGGRERTESEFRALFDDAGLHFDWVNEAGFGTYAVVGTVWPPFLMSSSDGEDPP